MRKVIVNSTPLIALCHVNQLGLEEMVAKNIFLSDKLINMCLQQVNESD